MFRNSLNGTLFNPSIGNIWFIGYNNISNIIMNKISIHNRILFLIYIVSFIVYCILWLIHVIIIFMIGGMIIGILTIVTDYYATNNSLVVTKEVVSQYAFPVILYATIIGFVGSCIDSLLGATCQATYYDPKLHKIYHANSTNRPPNAVHLVGHNLLTNEHVNLLSTAITCIIGGWLVGPLIIP